MTKWWHYGLFLLYVAMLIYLSWIITLHEQAGRRLL